MLFRSSDNDTTFLVYTSPVRFKKKSLFAIFFYTLVGFCFILESYNEEQFRYAKYFIPLILIGVYLPSTNLRKKIELDDFLVHQIKLYAVLIGWSVFVLVFNGFSTRFFEEIYFVLSPLLTLMVLQQTTDFKSLEEKIGIVFYMLVIANIIYTGANFFSDLIDLFSSLSSALLNSTSSTESPYAFEFGLFALYFFVKRKKINCLVALLFTVISFKRIALLGVILALLAFFLLRKFYQSKDRSRYKFILWTATIANIIVVVNLYLFSSGRYDDFIENVFGISANSLSMGRYELYQGIFEQVHLDTLFIGLGFGSITNYLTINQAFLTNLHSDVLKVFLEFGSLFFVFWVFQFYKKTSGSLPLLIFSLYINVVFLTDNVLIYYDVMLFYYLIVILVKESQWQNKPLPVAKKFEEFVSAV